MSNIKCAVRERVKNWLYGYKRKRKDKRKAKSEKCVYA
jgi:hypothetical protein